MQWQPPPEMRRVGALLAPAWPWSSWLASRGPREVPLALPEAVYAHRGQASAPELKPEPPLDPYRSSCYQWDPEEIASQWYPDDTPQYTGESSHDPWA